MRILSYTALVLVAFNAPFWIFAVCVCAYVFFWNGYELLPIGVLVDAQFGSWTLFPYLYSTLVLSAILMGVIVKPYIRFYANES